MLIGTYRHSIDSKKRMRMPSKFKCELGANFVITKGTGKNLFVFSADEFKGLYEKMTAIPLFDVEAQKPVRKFLSSAFDMEEDAQGRVLLPKELVSYANITKNIVFVGSGRQIRVFAEDVWNERASGRDYEKMRQIMRQDGL